MYLSKGASKVPSSPDTRLPQTSRHIHALPLQHTHRALVLRHLQADEERALQLLTNLQSTLRESNPYVQDFVHALIHVHFVQRAARCACNRSSTGAPAVQLQPVHA